MMAGHWLPDHGAVYGVHLLLLQGTQDRQGVRALMMSVQSILISVLYE